MSSRLEIIALLLIVSAEDRSAPGGPIRKPGISLNSANSHRWFASHRINTFDGTTKIQRHLALDAKCCVRDAISNVADSPCLDVEVSPSSGAKGTFDKSHAFIENAHE
jgi:hypothetical protein